MTTVSCRDIQDRLVDYADGALSPAEANEVAMHLADCDRCHATVDALQRSLDLAGLIWRDAERDLDPISAPAAARPRRPRWGRLVAAAAGIALLLAGALVWRLTSQGVRPPKMRPETTLVQVQRDVNAAEIAGQLLAAADLIAEQPGGRPIARDRYLFITTQFGDVSAAFQARLRLRSFPEGRVEQ